MNMPTTYRASPAAAGHAARTSAPPLSASRVALWRAVQLALAVAASLSFIIVGNIFAALPDMTPADRWQITLEIFGGKFVSVVLQLLVLHVFALPPSARSTPHMLRFVGMVLIGTVGNASSWMLLADTPSVRLGIVESTTTGVWSAAFHALTTAIFLLFQHGGQARSEEASRRLQRLQREQQAARRRVVEAQLQAMQARVDPQMFFEVLDSVQRLYATDAPRAEALLDELIAFLRAALPRLRSASSTLAQELELAASYFRLQSLRGGVPATARITLPDSLSERAFPAGVILPLLTEAHTAAIEVDAQPGAGTNDITVTLRAAHAPAPRVIAQVRKTLTALYGSAASIECLEPSTDTPIETRITIAHAAP
jgi:hypothetical protein